MTNSEFNARAFIHPPDEKRHFIGFNHGVPIILLMVINRMLADSRLFPQIGDPKNEASDLPTFTLFEPVLELLVQSNPQAIFPKDRKRQVYAIHLTNLVFDFLAAHEIAHIAHGHVDYNAEGGKPFVNEVASFSNTDTSNGNLESQAMELDADGAAAHALVNTVKFLVAGRSQLMPEISALYDNPAQAMFDVGVAVSITFRLFQDSKLNGVDLSKNTHPPTRSRQWLILRMMANYVDKLWDKNLVLTVEKEFEKAIWDVERAFEQITGTERQIKGLHEASVDDDYPAKLADCWNHSLRRKLARFAYIEPNYYGFERAAHAPTPMEQSAPSSAFVGAATAPAGGIIQDRGRGPEIAGTRITVYNLLQSFLDPTVTEEEICQIHKLTRGQVAAARAYVLGNPETVLAQHLKIEERMAANNPPEVIERAQRAKATFERFKQFLAIRQATNHVEAGPALERFPTFREWLAEHEKR